MDVIILAAGRGERLYPLTRHTPKCLIEIYNGTSLLEAQLRWIEKVGVDKVYLVVGYLAEQIEAKVQSYLRDFDIDLQIIYNPFWDVSNNLMTLWMARPYMSDDFIVVNGDDVFHYSVIERLKKRNENICMVIDKKEEYLEEDMKIKIQGGCITRVSKQIPVGEADGESIGMIRFRGTGAASLKRAIDDLARRPEGRNVFWLQAVQEIINSGFCVNYLEIAPTEWAEIDFHPDLKDVQEHVFQYLPKQLFSLPDEKSDER